MNKSPAAEVRLRILPNLRIILVTLLALPALLGLGFWQLDRAAQKDAIAASIGRQQSQPPVPLTADTHAELSVYRRVIAQGEFDNEHTWLLDNKQRHGQVGYEVISPFVLEGGGTILVNRGWLPGTGDRQRLPEIAAVAGERTIFAELAAESNHPLLNASSKNPDWPRVIMAIEVEAMAGQLDQPLLNGYLKLDESSPGAFASDWRAVTMSAQKHTGYAVQWFAMALALVLWFVYANTNVVAWWRYRRSHREK